MKAIRVYIDTSIIGGKYDTEFRKPSLRFFEQVEQKKFHLIISALVQEKQPGRRNI